MGGLRHFIGFRVGDKHVARLQALSEASGFTRGEILRRVLLSAEIPSARARKEVQDLLRIQGEQKRLGGFAQESIHRARGEGGAAGTGGTAGSDGTAGTGGMGGTGGTVDPCVGGQCDTDSQAKTNCQDTIDACNMLGAGGAPLTPPECEALGNAVYCTGTGGAPSFAVCDRGICATNEEEQAKCEAFMPLCLIHCEQEVCGEDECIGIVLVFICKEAL